MPERSTNDRTPQGRDSKGLRGGVVVAVLIVTCCAMLGAIYWVVRTGRL